MRTGWIEGTEGSQKKVDFNSYQLEVLQGIWILDLARFHQMGRTP